MKNDGSIIIYQTGDSVTKIETRLEDETVWLTQAQLCHLFQKSKATIDLERRAWYYLLSISTPNLKSSNI